MMAEVLQKYSVSNTFYPGGIIYRTLLSFKIIRSKRMNSTGHVLQTREKRSVYRLLIGKPDGKRSLARPRRSCVNNIKMNRVEIS
jgi:hypothetical protein